MLGVPKRARVLQSTLGAWETTSVNHANEVTQPKEREVFWHCWKLPVKLNRSDAIRIFDTSIKPSSYTYEKFSYNPLTGQLRTV